MSQNIQYYNDFSNYPSGTDLSLLGISGINFSNVPSQYSGYVSPYARWGTNAFILSGSFFSGSIVGAFLNSNTPAGFVYSARFSYSGTSSYSEGNAGNAGLIWNIKSLLGTSQTPTTSCNRFTVPRNGGTVLDRNVSTGGVSTLVTYNNGFDAANTAVGVNSTDFTLTVSGDANPSGVRLWCYINNFLVVSGFQESQSNTPRGGMFGFQMRPRITSSSAPSYMAMSNVRMENLMPPGFAP